MKLRNNTRPDVIASHWSPTPPLFQYRRCNVRADVCDKKTITRRRNIVFHERINYDGRETCFRSWIEGYAYLSWREKERKREIDKEKERKRDWFTVYLCARPRYRLRKDFVETRTSRREIVEVVDRRSLFIERGTSVSRTISFFYVKLDIYVLCTCVCVCVCLFV